MVERLPEGPLTILFSDVEGSTDLRTTRGDTAAQRILQAHEAIVRACVAEHDGCFRPRKVLSPARRFAGSHSTDHPPRWTTLKGARVS
ncbi:MAG: hypothetical protein ACRDYF_13945 [Acidimicrobiia bacterium]